MWFKLIEVNCFRKFRKGVTVRDLSPGLNVISGDNEDGKSTLLHGIRAALFDRYTSSAADGYKPYGEVVSPQVKLVFEIDGVEYTLGKIFSRKKDGEAKLVASDGRRWEGPQAEDFLSELLVFSYAQRGGTRPDLQGLAGLLWVEQARAYEAVTLTDQSRRQLHSIFDTQMSELLGGQHGESLHRRIADLREEHFDKRGKPRGKFRQLQEKRDDIAAKLQLAKDDLQAYESKTDQLGKLQSRLQSYQIDRAMEKAVANLAEANAKQGKIEALASQVARDKGKLGIAKAGQKVTRMAWEAREKLVENHRRAHEVAGKAMQLLNQKERGLCPVRDNVEGLKGKLTHQSPI